jgi:hypothetical protein
LLVNSYGLWNETYDKEDAFNEAMDKLSVVEKKAANKDKAVAAFLANEK